MASLADRQRANFYRSWDWAKLRYATLKRHGRRCQCCGATPDRGARITVDHIKPLRYHWHLRLDPENLQVLCSLCNRGKSCDDTTDFRPKPARAFRPTLHPSEIEDLFCE